MSDSRILSREEFLSGAHDNAGHDAALRELVAECLARMRGDWISQGPSMVVCRYCDVSASDESGMSHDATCWPGKLMQRMMGATRG